MQKVMVVIPVHNGIGMIERTLDSLLNQTLSNFEIVVIDNCSDDETVEVCKEYMDIFMPHEDTTISYTLITNKKNIGRIGNWNKALDEFRESDCGLCKIMFAGDTIEPTCLEKQLEKVTDLIQMVTCAHTVYSTEGDYYEMNHTLCGINVYLGCQALAISLEHGNWFAGTTSCILFSKKILNDIKFDKNLDWAADWKFWCQLVMSTNIVYIPEPLANFYMDSRKGYKRMAGSEQAAKEEIVVKQCIEALIKQL